MKRARIHEPSKLDGLVDEAQALSAKLAEMTPFKGSIKSWLKEACAMVGCNQASLVILRNRVMKDESHFFARQFLRRVEKDMVASDNYCCLGSNATRIAAHFGSDPLAVELADMKVTTSEAVAVAVVSATINHPSAFGVVDDVPQHVKAIAEMEKALDGLLAEMKEAWSWDDLTVDNEGLTNDERDRGLVRAVFKRAPSISINAHDWPKRLLIESRPSPTKGNGSLTTAVRDGVVAN